MTIREYYNKIKSIDLQPIKEESVVLNKEKIIRLNQSQLRLGLTTKETNIKPRYSDIYLKRKNRLSTYVADGGTPDLYLTGAFYGEMDLIVENGEYFLTSFDSKVGFLAERYRDIFGLTRDSKEITRVFVSRTFLELVRNKLSN